MLEGVHSWIMVLCYIAGTVISGYPLFGGVAGAVCAAVDPECQLSRSSPHPTYVVLTYVMAVLDTIVYVFSPQWCCLLLRIVQRRPLRHRMTARSIVIGDVPWVAQSVESYLSKLFGCSYSAAGVTVYSANPNDHLVHRLTHRVVRGGLLVCGRPDGRLMALTTSECSVCLSTSQASSIVSIGSTLESITIGHNPSSMGLCHACVFLPGKRKDFYCEHVLKRDLGIPNLNGRSGGMLLGDYSNLRKQSLGIINDDEIDVTDILSSISTYKNFSQ